MLNSSINRKVASFFPAFQPTVSTLAPPRRTTHPRHSERRAGRTTREISLAFDETYADLSLRGSHEMSHPTSTPLPDLAPPTHGSEPLNPAPLPPLMRGRRLMRQGAEG